MNNHIKKQIHKRNKTTTTYLTTYTDLFNHSHIYGVIDLKEYGFLLKINCENNKITQIINICSTVKYLNCRNNLISEFEYLPDDLETFICDDNKISNFDNLPSGLKFLSCDNNKIVRLENLPLGLEYLSCGSNPIVNLDFLPAGLTKLFLIGLMKNLISLNDLPISIEQMICTESIEKISKNNFPKGLVLENEKTGIWKKIKNKKLNT
jgi:hypothetical protein